MISFIIFLFILYLIFKFIYNIMTYDEYKAIYEYRCKLVNLEIYRLREEYKQLINEACRSGSFSKFIEWNKNHSDFTDYPYLRITIGIAQMDITLPDDGPYTNKEADRILYSKFGKYYLKTVKKVIRNYYRNNSASRYNDYNNHKREDDIIDVEFTEVRK